MFPLICFRCSQQNNDQMMRLSNKVPNNNENIKKNDLKKFKNQENVFKNAVCKTAAILFGCYWGAKKRKLFMHVYQCWFDGDRGHENVILTGTLCFLHYHQISNISHTLGDEIVCHSDVIGASPVGTAPTTSSQLNTWLQWIGQRQLWDETRNNKVSGCGEAYIRRLTVFVFMIGVLHCLYAFNLHNSMEKKSYQIQ